MVLNIPKLVCLIDSVPLYLLLILLELLVVKFVRFHNPTIVLNRISGLVVFNVAVLVGLVNAIFGRCCGCQ